MSFSSSRIFRFIKRSLIESAEENQYDPQVDQRVVERCGVVVALAADKSKVDKLRFTAYDTLHSVRADLFSALLGWEIPDAEGMVCYRGGKLIDMNNAYLWYQFEFEYYSRIMQKTDPRVRIANGKKIYSNNQDEYAATENDGNTYNLPNAGLTEKELPDYLKPETVYEEALSRIETLEQSQTVTEDQKNAIIKEVYNEKLLEAEPKAFNTIYANFILSPSADLPHDGELPLSDGFPDVALPDMAVWIDFTENPDAGSFGRGFASGFKFYEY